MNIINRLTFRHIKENKKRTIVTIIGIIISTAMVTAVCVSVMSLCRYFSECDAYKKGDYYADTFASEESIKKLAEDKRLTDVSAVCDICSFSASEKDGEFSAVGTMGGANADYFKNFITSGFTGRYPNNESEIIVDKTFLEDNNLNWKLFDKVTLDMGSRYYKNAEGSVGELFGSRQIGEYFVKKSEKEFTVVGITEDNQPTLNRNNPILCGTNKFTEGAEVFVKTEEKTSEAAVNISKAFKDAGIQEYNMNFLQFRTSFVVLAGDSTMQILFTIALFMLAIVFIVSVVLIFNAFAMSLRERQRYLGMLASVGCTGKQKRMSVYSESFILGAVGIPLGIAAGIGGMAVTFRLIRPLILKSGLSVTDDIYIKTYVDWRIILLVVVLSTFTIFISSVIPAVRASKITPIDALRQTNVVKVKAKKLKASKIVRKIFGYEGELASKNQKRNGKKSALITFSLIVSVAAFISVSYFCSMFMQEIDREANMCNVMVSAASEDLDKIRDAASEVDKADSVFLVGGASLSSVNLDKSYYTDKGYDEYADSDYLNLIFVFDDDFDKICEDNGINPKSFYDNKNKVLLLRTADHKQNGTDIFSDVALGKTFSADISDYNLSTISFTVGGLIDYNKDNAYCFVTSEGVRTAFMPLSSAKKNIEKFNTTNVSVGIITEEHEQVYDELTKSLGSEEFKDSPPVVQDIDASVEMMYATINLMRVFIYGFIVLIALITTANIFNTISTSINSRRKEFAMLKSVGVTPKGFKRMIIFESMFYGIKSLLIGLPAGFVLSYALYWALLSGSQNSAEEIAFAPNPFVYLGAALAVFLIIGLSMLYSVAKIKNDAIIETLKLDIN